MKPLVRWTIGPVSQLGFDCLAMSVERFLRLYDVEAVICCNGLTPSQEFFLEHDLGVSVFSQNEQGNSRVPPIGVAWKLYPPRLALDRHELFIDNDLVIEQKIELLDMFFVGNKTLLLEGESRNYGSFDRHVPPDHNINSGLFGLPPGFDFKQRLDFYARDWTENCAHSSRTWDEQGIVAAILLAEPHLIVPRTTVTNCEGVYHPAAGMHFVGLNRVPFHRPFADYRGSKVKLF